ncbi:MULTISPECIES: hypothetical protein [Clostridium]|uniref:hypothetical protein n=1 Tax=Clostridium TaxID=1485 RepID=UPI001897F9F8|nr:MULTISPECIES: hypothetical protein [Clostridium]MDI9216985.1 hypothetical protein [Clostridium tertium]
MKVIVSHDVDNLTRKEHKKDLIVIKMIIRAFLELFLFRINLSTFLSRLNCIIKNNFTNIDKLVQFDVTYNTKATYFFATSNDNTLAYKAEAAKEHIKYILNNNLNVGIHGIAYNDIKEMKKEHDTFNLLHDTKDIGIRMHYLRRDKDTFSYMKDIGYTFDTTEYSKELKQPYITEEGLIEIPFHIMDSYLFQENGLQKYNLKYAIDFTKKIIDSNYDKDIIFNINLHQEYFSNGWKDWKDWYIWLVTYCNSKKIDFISYQEVVNELTDKSDRYKEHRVTR